MGASDTLSLEKSQTAHAKGSSRVYAPEDYLSGENPVWCRGCGDFNVLFAFCDTLARLGIPPEDVFVASGIGCSGRFPGFVKAYGLNGIHGRPLPVALGAKVANPNLCVFALSGDGDGLNIGGGHIPHVARKNPDMVYMIIDNGIFGLTKGQYSGTTRVLSRTTTTPYGHVEEPLSPTEMLISYDCSFVAVGYSGERQHLSYLLTKAILHEGFAVIRILTHCPTYNRVDVSARSVKRNLIYIRDEEEPYIAPSHDEWEFFEENGYRFRKNRVDDATELLNHDKTSKMRAYDLAVRAQQKDNDGVFVGTYYQRYRPTLNQRLDEIKELAVQSVGKKSLWNLL